MKLNRLSLVMIVACLFLTGVAQSLDAQSKVAIVDVGKVFKSHPHFSQQLEQLRLEAENFQKESIELRRQMMAKSEQLKILIPGTDDYKAKESALAQELAALEVEQQQKMRVLMQREAKLHFDTYNEVKSIINRFCEQQGIRLVLRHSQLELDPENPNSIMQEVNSPVVFYEPDRDITGAILQIVNGTASTQNSDR